jgi:mono/diheme cytochrome c family protein
MTALDKDQVPTTEDGSMSRLRGLLVSVMVSAASLATTADAQQAQRQDPNPWSQCCGMGQWPMEPGMMGRGMGPMAGSMPRHHQAMMSGVPAPYAGLTNPLPRTRETLERGAAVYAENCVACHGPTGRGDGEAGRDLVPPPGNLAWLARMPMVRWDPFMYWTVAEGGAPFGTAMPAFKEALSSDDIWAVIAYVQARLPQVARPVE